MIRSEKQAQVTRNRLSDFKDALRKIKNSDLDLLSQELHINALSSQIEDLQNELKEYERLKHSEVTLLHVSLQNFPEVLIKSRISLGWSQMELAHQMGMKEQQIQRYEACNYATASFPKIVAIANIMGLQVPDIKAKLKAKQIIVEGIDPIRIEQAKEKLRGKRSLLSI